MSGKSQGIFRWMISDNPVDMLIFKFDMEEPTINYFQCLNSKAF